MGRQRGHGRGMHRTDAQQRVSGRGRRACMKGVRRGSDGGRGHTAGCDEAGCRRWRQGRGRTQRRGVGPHSGTCSSSSTNGRAAITGVAWLSGIRGCNSRCCNSMSCSRSSGGGGSGGGAGAGRGQQASARCAGAAFVAAAAAEAVGKAGACDSGLTVPHVPSATSLAPPRQRCPCGRSLNTAYPAHLWTSSPRSPTALRPLSPNPHPLPPPCPQLFGRGAFGGMGDDDDMGGFGGPFGGGFPFGAFGGMGGMPGGGGVRERTG